MSVELAMLYDLALIPSKQRVAGSNPAERAIYIFYAKYSFIITEELI